MLQTVSSEGSGPTDRHNEGVLKQRPPFPDGSDVPVRVLCNGKTSAFQADDTGSIPVTRFLNINSVLGVTGLVSCSSDQMDDFTGLSGSNASCLDQ